MTRPVVVCAGLLVLVAGCGVSVGPQERPEVTYYHLAVPAPEPTAGSLGIDLALLPFSQSAALDRDGIRFRKSDVEGGYRENHRWAEPVESMLRTALQRDLDRSGLVRVVLLEEAGHADAIVVAEVLRLDEEEREDGWTAVVEIEIDVVLRATGPEDRDRVVLSRCYRAERAAAGEGIADAVRALSSATGALFADFRKDLTEVLR